jgi:O-methyltransferase
MRMAYCPLQGIIPPMRTRLARQLVKRPLKGVLRGLGYELRPVAPPWPRDFQPDDAQLYLDVAHYTMTTPEAIYALAGAVRHIVSSDVPGAIVECGVWRGGSMMAVATTLLQLGRTDVDLYLFDTFDGMSAPTSEDVDPTGELAEVRLAREPKSDQSVLWAQATLDQVQDALKSVPYPPSKIHFVQGRVEDTVPSQAPGQIALLRLDTDWYESTRHELIHLYPRLGGGGILILDDYGWWRGSGKATDEYFRDNGPAPLLVRIDDGGVRLAVKPNAGSARLRHA